MLIKRLASSPAIRYAILIALGLNIRIFYLLFMPLTIYPVSFMLGFFFNVSLSENIIFLDGAKILLTDACIAGSAYYLLLILNLSAPMNIKKRFFSLFFSVLAFLLLNIARIFVFSLLFLNSFSFFNIFHLIFWYALSTLIVFAIWLAETKIFKIKEIPFYTDFKSVFQAIKNAT